MKHYIENEILKLIEKLDEVLNELDETREINETNETVEKIKNKCESFQIVYKFLCEEDLKNIIQVIDIVIEKLKDNEEVDYLLKELRDTLIASGATIQHLIEPQSNFIVDINKYRNLIDNDEINQMKYAFYELVTKFNGKLINGITIEELNELKNYFEFIIDFSAILGCAAYEIFEGEISIENFAQFYYQYLKAKTFNNLIAEKEISSIDEEENNQAKITVLLESDIEIVYDSEKDIYEIITDKPVLVKSN